MARSRERRQEILDLGPRQIGAAGRALSEKRFGERALSLLEAEHALLDAAGDDQVVDEDGARLPDAVRAIGGLRLRGGVPPRVVVDHRVGARQVQARAARLQADEKDVGVAALERVDRALAVLRRARERDVSDARVARPWRNEREHAA